MDEVYGWGRGMRAISHALLANLMPVTGPILELGCGSGVFLRQLNAQRPAQSGIGLDTNGLALGYAHRQVGGSPLVQADLRRLPFAAERFRLLIALDVLDQNGINLQQALRECRRVLQPDGLLFLRLSAHRWLQSEHDTAFNTGRRYNKQEVQTLLAQTHFAPIRITHANMLLAPPVILLRLLQRWRLAPLTVYDYQQTLANRLLLVALRGEARWLRRYNLPFGISLYILARKEA